MRSSHGIAPMARRASFLFPRHASRPGASFRASVLKCAVLLVGLFLAWALAPIAAQKSPDGPDTQHDKKLLITI